MLLGRPQNHAHLTDWYISGPKNMWSIRASKTLWSLVALPQNPSNTRDPSNTLLPILHLCGLCLYKGVLESNIITGCFATKSETTYSQMHTYNNNIHITWQVETTSSTYKTAKFKFTFQTPLPAFFLISLHSKKKTPKLEPKKKLEHVTAKDIGYYFSPWLWLRYIWKQRLDESMIRCGLWSVQHLNHWWSLEL